VQPPEIEERPRLQSGFALEIPKFRRISSDPVPQIGIRLLKGAILASSLLATSRAGTASGAEHQLGTVAR
jgi:hypothetical protein